MLLLAYGAKSLCIMNLMRVLTRHVKLGALLLAPLLFSCNSVVGNNTAGSTVPGAPTNVTGVPGNGQATVSWTAPASNGGYAITNYTVKTVQDTFSGCTTASSTSCVVGGLTNGKAYTFTVKAINAIGVGPLSLPSDSITPVAVVPDAPTGLTAMAGNNQASVFWKAPASNGGSVILNYAVQAVEDTSKRCSASSSTFCAVPGLINGTSYTFTVTAFNVAGASATSSPTVAVIPSALPGVGWRALQSGTTSTLSSVARSDSLLVVVGDRGVILTSSDGAT